MKLRKFSKETLEKMSKSHKIEIDYYNNKSVTNQNFKQSCRRQGWNYDDFERIKTNEFSGTQRKYYFILKK